MLSNLVHGLTSLGGAADLGYLFAGALIGMFVGVIPGLGGAVVLSIVLIFVYHLDLTGTLCLFLGTHAGSYYSASVTSILLNTPAHPEAFAVTFDGFPMAQKGNPGRALGISACSTCVGGFIGCVVLLGFLQIINHLPGLFHPPDYVALVILAMLLVGTLRADSVAKAVVAVGAGLMVASIGPSPITGISRYAFGAEGLANGVSLVALSLGAFAISQMVMVFGTGTSSARQDMTGMEIGYVRSVDLGHGFGRELIAGVGETFRYWRTLLQGGLTGALVGIIPGVGGFAANFLSYGIAKQTARRRDLMGTGIPEGIIAPEGASLAKEAGSMIPIIGLGIPGSVGGALFIAALAIKGVKEGYGFTQAYPVVSYQIVWIIALAGLIGTVGGVLAGPQLAKVTRVPGPLIFPFILALSVVGPYLTDTQLFSVVEVLVFGVVGLVLRRLRYPLACFILGLVLGPTFETNVYLTRNIYPGMTFLIRRLFADVIFAIAIAVLVLKAVELRRAKKRAVAVPDVLVMTSRSIADGVPDASGASYPVLSLITTVLLIGVSAFFLGYGGTRYSFVNFVMPAIASVLVLVPALAALPGDIRNCRAHRRSGGVPVPSLEAEPSLAAEPSPQAEPLPQAGDEERPGMPPPAVDKSWGANGQYRREAIGLATLVALILLCWTFGFVWGATVFVAGYGLTCTGRYFKTRGTHLAYCAAATVAIWLVVYEVFHLTQAFFTPLISL